MKSVFHENMSDVGRSGLMFLFGCELMLMAFVLFSIGLIMFAKRENPNTLSQTLFGWKLFSQGIVPQIYGLFLMILSGSAIISLLWAFIRYKLIK